MSAWPSPTYRPALSRPALRAERAAVVLRRLVELARAAARGVAALAAAAALSVGGGWGVWVAARPPTGPNDWAARVVVLAIGLTPPAVLALFLAGLQQLAELPRRARELPPDLRTRVLDVRMRAVEPRRIGLVAAVVRLARLVFEARDVVSPYAVVSAVLRPALLLAALAAAFTAVIEIPIALVAALVLVTSMAG
jgi:hypothetical protein